MNRPSVWGGVLAGVLFAGLLLGARTAHAQLTPQQKQEARQHYEKATRAYDVGKYQEAIEEYQKAYEIGADPPMLYNIAQAYRLSDQPAEALRMYRRYLQRAPNAKNREDVEHKIADLEKLLEDRKKATAAPPPAQPPPAPVIVPPISPAPVLPPPASTASTPPLAPLPPAPPPAGHNALEIAGLVLAGVGVVAAVGAGYEGYVARQKADKVSEQSMSKPPVTFDPAVEENGHRANTAAIALGIGAGVAVVGGAGLYLIGRRSAARAEAATAQRQQRLSATVAPWLGAGLVGAGAALRF